VALRRELHRFPELSGSETGEGADRIIILGANNIGIKSVLIKTGEFQKTDLEGEVHPDFIFDVIGDIARILCFL